MMEEIKDNKRRKELGDLCIWRIRAQSKLSKGHTLSGPELYCISGKCGGNCKGKITQQQVYEFGDFKRY